jgi:outer membrane protein OmpA-like peptidoglycan-associated protein
MKLLKSLLIFLFAIVAQAQESICPDVVGAVSHPLITNYKNSCIIGYNETKFDIVTLPASKVSSKGALKEVTAEGKIIDIIYGIDNAQNATVVEVKRNYEQAFNNSGIDIVYATLGKKSLITVGKSYPSLGSIDYLKGIENQKLKGFTSIFNGYDRQNNDVAYILAQGNTNGKNYTVALYISHNRLKKEGLANNIFVLAKIVESKPMESGQVTVASIEDKIKNEGKEVFHNILFDFGSDKLTPKSFAVVETLAKYLAENTDKKFYIVGHTDNVGALASNQTLSEKRAKAVLTALTGKYGVADSQVSAHGVGQLAPLAINSTEEGKALNRRVEIVLR